MLKINTIASITPKSEFSDSSSVFSTLKKILKYKANFVISCASQTLKNCKLYPLLGGKRLNSISAGQTSPVSRFSSSFFFFPPWISWHKQSLFAQCSKADKETRVCTRTHTQGRHAWESFDWGMFLTRLCVPCPDASDFRLGNIKLIQKQDPAMHVLSWTTRGHEQWGLYFTYRHGDQTRVDTGRKRKKENPEDKQP